MTCSSVKRNDLNLFGVMRRAGVPKALKNGYDSDSPTILQSFELQVESYLVSVLETIDNGFGWRINSNINTVDLMSLNTRRLKDNRKLLLRCCEHRR